MQNKFNLKTITILGWFTLIILAFLFSMFLQVDRWVVNEIFVGSAATYLLFLIIGSSFINYVFKRQEDDADQLHYLANHDTLTTLPNRHAYQEWVKVLIDDESIKSLTLMFIDLDNFKTINDTFGHSKGDQLLKAVTSRISNQIHNYHMFSRFGGDEFVILFANIENEIATSIASDLIKVFEKPFALDENHIYASASVGIASYPEDASNNEELLKSADIAMYGAKNAGKNKFSFYNLDMFEKTKRKNEIDTALDEALTKKELYLMYQPQISLNDERLVGVEALIRWDSKELGSVSPVEFISIAEENGKIIPIGAWIIDMACRQIRFWQGTVFENVVVAINISAKQFMHQDLHSYIENAIYRNGIDASLLSVEITESAVMYDVESVVKILNKLKKLGISIAIDDFGTGYSSLSYLKKLPIDKLKIDREFIKDLLVDKDDRMIVKAIVALAKSLDLKVVAEGADQKEHVEFLKGLECEIVQGYIYSKPLLATDMKESFKPFN